jgi:BirA family biotin operon repressor/biotin-[acetyl-CoA-carboxylase] ligase
LKFTIVRKDTVPSTNDAAKALARAGAPAGTVVIAAAQTGGRGTKGRGWDSPPGLGLYVSVILNPPADVLALLPLAAGLAARAAVEKSAGVDARLLWPNDLLWEGRKLGGILCESGFTGGARDITVVGIGINIGQAEGDFSGELCDHAVSVSMAAGRPVEVEVVLDALLPALDAWTARLAAEGGAAIAAAFAARAVPEIGAAIMLDRGDGPFRARYEGIAPDGALMVSTDSGARRFLSGEIVRIR